MADGEDGFDLVLFDVHLPGRHGLEALRSLRRRGHPPLVAMIGQSDGALAVEALSVAASDDVTQGEGSRGSRARGQLLQAPR